MTGGCSVNIQQSHYSSKHLELYHSEDKTPPYSPVQSLLICSIVIETHSKLIAYSHTDILIPVLYANSFPCMFELPHVMVPVSRTINVRVITANTKEYHDYTARRNIIPQHFLNNDVDEASAYYKEEHDAAIALTRAFYINLY